MEELLEQIKSPSIFCVHIGIALVVISYLLAGGYDRAVPSYDEYYGCRFGQVDSLTSIEPHGRIENYSQHEWLGCLPLHYILLYALAIFGTGLCAWGLVANGKRMFPGDQIPSKDFLTRMIALATAPLIIIVGVWMLHPEFSLFGGGFYTLGDLFDTLSEILILIGLITIVVVVLGSFAEELKGASIR